jgi:hypothetical protein
MKLVQEFTGNNWLSVVKITVDIKCCASLGNKIEEQWLKYGPKQPAAVWQAWQRNSRFEQTKLRRTYSRKSAKISSETYVKALKRVKERINCVCRGKDDTFSTR